MTIKLSAVSDLEALENARQRQDQDAVIKSTTAAADFIIARPVLQSVCPGISSNFANIAGVPPYINMSLRGPNATRGCVPHLVLKSETSWKHARQASIAAGPRRVSD